MTRRKPLCAGCGKPLAKSHMATAIHEFVAVKGRPLFGTHFVNDPEHDCSRTIPQVHGPDAQPLSSILRMIAARGPGRVCLVKGVTLDEACASADRVWAEADPAEKHGTHTYESRSDQ